MVLPIIYCNRFIQHTSWKTLVAGIYMSFAPAPTKEHLDTKSRILLCKVPISCGLKEAIQKVMIKLLHLFKQGINIEFTRVGLM